MFSFGPSVPTAAAAAVCQCLLVIIRNSLPTVLQAVLSAPPLVGGVLPITERRPFVPGLDMLLCGTRFDRHEFGDFDDDFY